MQYSSRLTRFLAILIDGIIFSIPAFFVFCILGFALSFAISSDESGGSAVIFTLAIIVLAIIYSAAVVIFSAWMISNEKYMRTPGKYMLGIKIVHADESNLSFGEALARVIVKSFLDPYTYIPAFFREDRQCLHDMVVKSYVVDR